MFFRNYNAFPGFTRGLTSGTFILGLILIGFGLLVYILKEIFAAIAAAIFIIAGIGCITAAAKIFLSSLRAGNNCFRKSNSLRENIQIHTEEHYEM
ncbi:MAG: hypothetical protein ABIG61_08035 [Planctomycetota bacterium]